MYVMLCYVMLCYVMLLCMLCTRSDAVSENLPDTSFRPCDSRLHEKLIHCTIGHNERPQEKSIINDQVPYQVQRE